MSQLVRINDEVITAEGFVTMLKLTGRFDGLIEEIVREKLTVHVARKSGLEATPEDVQQRADQLRRVKGLHRTMDMNRWMDQMGINLEELEAFIVEMILYDKMQANIVNDAQVEEYFSLHAPEFDSIIISHIIVDAEGKAREVLAIAEDDPDMFDVLAREHSLADTAGEGGYIGPVMRGNLAAEIEAKVFHAESGDVLGPFAAPGGDSWEIFLINEKRTGVLDEDTANHISRKLKEQWLVDRAAENHVEVC